MANLGDRDLHRLLIAIRRQQQVSCIVDAEPAERSLPSTESVRRLFQDVPEALAESLQLPSSAPWTSPTRRILPSLELPAGESADTRLERICRQRLQEMHRHDTVYAERLAKELALLRARGLASYFLIVAEITGRAQQMGIAVVGRGSAAGSLVAYLLGITGVDPIQHGLYFERFLHAQRHDLPDIDLDLPSERRDELIDWVFERFGRDKVAMASAHQTFGRRAALRDGLKALGMGLNDVNEFCERLPSDDWEPSLPLDLLPSAYRAAVPLLEHLIGKMQHISVHSGGVVIADRRIDSYVPLERAP